MSPSVNFKDLDCESILYLLHSPCQSPSDDLPLDVTIALFTVMFFVTSYRCFARYTKKLWGHNDSTALFSLLSFVLFVIGLYICFQSSVRRILWLNFFFAISGSTYLTNGVLFHL